MPNLFIAVIRLIACGLASPVLAQAPTRGDTAFVTPVELMSAGTTLRGTMHVTEGPGPHPTIVHLQGFPGSRSTAFEQYLQGRGFNAVSIFVRGQQTSDGRYTIAGMPDDAAAVVAWLRTPAAREAWRIDPSRIVLIGVSAGSLGALRATGVDPALRCVAVIVPFNWALAGLSARTDSTVRQQFHAFIAGMSSRPEPPARVDTSLVTEIVRDAERLDLRVAAAALRDRRVFLVGAANDETAPAPEHFFPVVRAARSAPGAVVRDTVVQDGHNLTTTLNDVFAATVRWLRNDCLR